MSSHSEVEKPELDLKQIFAQLFARKWLVSIACVLGLIVGAAVAIIPPNLYRASAVVQIEKRNTGISLPAELIGELLTGSKGTSSSFGTEIHVIKSRLILEPAAQEMGLLTRVTPKTLPIWGDFFLRLGAGEGSFFDAYIPSSYARGNEILSIGAFDVAPQLENIPLELTILDEASYTVNVGGQEFVGRIGSPTSLNGFGDILVSSFDAAPGRVFFITRLPTRAIVGSLSRGLAISERRDTGIIDFAYTGLDPSAVVPTLNTIIETYQTASLQRRSAEIDQSIAFIADQLPLLKSELQEAQAKLLSFRKQNEVASELSVGTQDLLSRIVGFETTVERLDFELEELLKRVTPNHPDYQKLSQERDRVISRLAAAKRDLETIPEAEQRLALLTREVERARSLELQLTERIEQLRILKASAVGNVRVLEPAEIAVHAGPDRVTPLLLGLLSGFALASIWVFARNYFHSGIEDGRELEDLGLPLFATISAVPNGEAHTKQGAQPFAVSNPSHPTVEAFRSLRTGLNFSLSSSKCRTVLITSSAPGEGKSFVAHNLAIVMASVGKRVLLVDTDMRRGYLRKTFNLSKSVKGLSELLSESADIQSAIHNTGVEGLDLIPTGRRPPNSAELLEKQTFKDFLEWAHSNYDYVVLDAPPILAVTDPIIIGANNVVMLLVVRHTKTTPAELQAVLKTMKNSGLKPSGAILNGYDVRASRYGSYGYKYGYYYGGYNYKYAQAKD